MYVWSASELTSMSESDVRNSNSCDELTGTREDLVHGLLPARGEELVSLVNDGEPSLKLGL